MCCLLLGLIHIIWNLNDANFDLRVSDILVVIYASAAVVGVGEFKFGGYNWGEIKGKKSSYQDAAIELGKELVSRNIDLVYGGGSIGLMGLVSHAVHDGGRHVIGVIPKTLMPRELTGETVGEVKAVADMHQRKAEMAKHSDAFIALPGGYGTLEELLEVITWAQLGIHDKPVGLLNVDGYYNSLLSFIDKAVEEGFISPNARHIIVSAPTARELVKKLEEYVPRHERVASKLSWEIERLGYPQTFEISSDKWDNYISRREQVIDSWAKKGPLAMAI
ncbi:hypothetical protein TEA_028805 [Camellia sinensis var. sinensis]|uniref:Cytokinin riboside 5'-monophosphate phosphoribohydrolase n=1 Tax=Camellia sinensis var. sinensis TaxID=542762 RepID=A0A4S4EMM1_CAMSN|nr:hypothetical protein TEA_028805 [Camellia sinensis var. sinensis]